MKTQLAPPMPTPTADNPLAPAPRPRVRKVAPKSPDLASVQRLFDGGERTPQIQRHPVDPGFGDLVAMARAIQRKPASGGGTEPRADEPAVSPVLWGQAVSPGSESTLYASVKAPGHTLAEIATYLYGSADKAAALSAANGGLPERLGPGRTLRLPKENLTPSVLAEINRGLDEGTVLRSEGIPREDETRIILYRFSGGGQNFELTEAQFVGMMQGAFHWVALNARGIRDSAETGKWVHEDHIKGTNSWIRGISSWMGGTECPELAIWEPARAQATALSALLQSLRVSPQSQLTLKGSLDALQRAAEALDTAERTWRAYIKATIEGAESAVHVLTITRNVSFGVAAALAGAVAAPVVFGAVSAAGGGTLVAGGTAIAAGAGTGGLVNASLEFTGATAGTGLSTAVTPGKQTFDWGYVGERSWEGLKSGAVQGGLGAAGALAAPGVSSALGTKMFGSSASAGTLSAGQQLALKVTTGVTIGVPAGMAGAAIDMAPDVATGKMTGSEYAQSILWGGAQGGVLGGLMSLLPINGLYRTKGILRGDPVTPRWMLEGPFSPLQRDFRAPPGFENLAVNDLPPLDEGYTWVRLGNTWEPISVSGPMRQPVTIRLYGPDPSGRFNYVVWQGDHIVCSRAFTRPTGGTFQGQPGATRRDFPMSSQDFRGQGTGGRWVRGHNIDFADTVNTPGSGLSTMDPMNYTPEQADWGMHIRRILVGDIRAAQGAQGQYRQMEFFDPGTPPRFTTNGRRIPDGVFFAEYDSATGLPVRAWRVPWAQSVGLRTRAAAALFVIPVQELPVVLQSPVQINAGAAGVAASEAADHARH